MGKGKHLTAADRDEIWVLYAQGLNANEIYKRVGRSYWTVENVFRDTGGIRPRQRTRSRRSLSLEEREEISRGVRAQESFTTIAERIGRSPSTVSREVARNGGRADYRATRADKAAQRRACRPKTPKLIENRRLGETVAEKLGLRWSPEQIAAWLRTEHANDDSMWVSPETIYVAIYRHNFQSSPPARCLRTERLRRRPRRRGRREKRGPNPNMTLISKRPDTVADRREPGHWEGDLIFGRGHQRAIGTVVERTSRYVVLLDLIDGWPTKRVCDLLEEHLSALPPALVKTLTWDQGSEMSAHELFTKATGVPVFFCYPRSPWQRPTNENTNGLLRNYFPKGSDFARYTKSDLDRVAHELNTRPRRSLNWLTPEARFAGLCASTP